MTIKLDWNGGSTDIDGYYVYRSETPMDPLNPPTPIATLAKTVKTWTDVNTPRGKLYYYRVSAYKGSEVAITFERAMAYVPYTGPGEPDLVIGDWEAGFFGEIPLNDFIPRNTLLSTVAPGLIVQVDLATRWFKMAYMGKVIYMPDASLGTVMWSALYQNGLVFGDLDPSLIFPYVKTNMGVIPQNKRIIIGEDEFIFRLPRSRKDPLSTGSTNLEKGGNEWDMVYAKLWPTRSLTEFNQNKAFRSFNGLLSAQIGAWTADSNTGASSAVITRAMSSGITGSVDQLIGSTWTVNSIHLVPVLELVL